VVGVYDEPIITSKISRTRAASLKQSVSIRAFIDYPIEEDGYAIDLEENGPEHQ
jgi:hypothetical protein